jgi:hypothetical protein
MAVGCLYRALSPMVQILFAQHERYFISDKGALDECAQFAGTPRDFKARVERVLSCPGEAAPQLTKSVEEVRRLLGEIVS